MYSKFWTFFLVIYRLAFTLSPTFQQFRFAHCFCNASLSFLMLSNFQLNPQHNVHSQFKISTSRNNNIPLKCIEIVCYLLCVRIEIILTNKQTNKRKKTRIKTRLEMGKTVYIMYKCRACKSLQPTKFIQIKFILCQYVKNTFYLKRINAFSFCVVHLFEIVLPSSNGKTANFCLFKSSSIEKYTANKNLAFLLNFDCSRHIIKLQLHHFSIGKMVSRV